MPRGGRFRCEGDHRLARTLLRQLALLTRRVPAAGPRALAVAVYSGSAGEQLEARESGIEGVACVDDAARAAVVLHRLWVATGNHALRKWSDGLLAFVAWMHAGDGLWNNFILDWDGAKNVAGPTSAAGVNFWQARAMLALAETGFAANQGGDRQLLTQAFDAAARRIPPADVRAVHALAALAVLKKDPDPGLDALLGTWCDEIAASQRGGILMNSPDERGQPHLWGHVQEGVLAEASAVLGRRDLREAAISSAERVFTEVIGSGFDLQHVSSYDVQSVVFATERLAAVTGRPRYAESARMARSWFDGRNPAGAVIYDRAAGRVADGLDDGRVSDRSGAEANITACDALLSDPGVLSMARGWTQAW